jgi:hypothetical protein
LSELAARFRIARAAGRHRDVPVGEVIVQGASHDEDAVASVADLLAHGAAGAGKQIPILPDADGFQASMASQVEQPLGLVVL